MYDLAPRPWNEVASGCARVSAGPSTAQLITTPGEVRHRPLDCPPELRRAVVVVQVSKFVQEYVIHKEAAYSSITSWR
jgi:hypothetical protein